MPNLKLALLGTPHVYVDEQSIAVESRKALALLFYLAVTHQHQSRDLLATLFWPEQGQSRARASLRQVLWLLRNAGLEPWLMVEQDALALQGDYWCDVHHFQAELSAGHVDEALALYQGDLLAGFNLRDCPEFDQWQFLQADELRRQLAGALEAWVVRCREAGEYARGLTYARRWLALDALHEPVHRHLMQLYAYAGQQAAALRQYDECVRLLDEELGVDPEEETVALYEAIKTRQLAPPVTPPVASPVASPLAPPVTPPIAPPVDLAPALHTTPIAEKLPAPTPASALTGGMAEMAAPTSPPRLLNLPMQITPFVGREAEIDELARVLASDECRLVSIVGPGGIGKTRLAVQVARCFAEMPPETAPGTTPDTGAKQNTARLDFTQVFPQGVLFVALNPADSVNGIVAAIAEAGGFVFYSNDEMRQQLLDYLHDREMLLLLDNFEHLLDYADFVIDILTHAPQVTILVTSREALNLHGEWLWSVNGLRFPEAEIDEAQLWDYSAVRMFVQSARRAQPDFALKAEYPHVVEICRLVGGMPLAIELAAAWLRVVPCAQIVHEIKRNLDFLTTRMRDVPDRHRSIQAVFEHSWRLLSPFEQEIFQQLSIFRGGFDRTAAQKVAGASWLNLATLVEKSLVSVNSSGRYSIHELLRQYGAGKLEEDPVKKDALQARFGAYFVNFLHVRETLLNGPEQIQAAADVARELDNVRAAYQWVLQQRRLDDVNRSATGYYFFCQLQSRYLECFQAMSDTKLYLESLEESVLRDLTLAHVLNHLTWMSIRLGQFERAATVAQQSIDLYAKHEVRPQPLMGGDTMIPLALVRQIQGDYARAVALATEALDAATRRNDPLNLTFAHYALTSITLALGNHEEAHQHGKQACALATSSGITWFLAYTLNELGKVERVLGNHAEARSHFQRSYDIRQEFNDPEGMAVALNHLGEIAYLQAEYDMAQQMYMEAARIYGDVNDRGGVATSSRGLGRIACALHDHQAAKKWFAQAFQTAIEIRYWPMVYSLLSDVSQLLIRMNAPALALEALALTQHQPTADFETREQARQRLALWQHEWGAAQVEEALQRSKDGGRDGEIERLLSRILAELTTY